MIDQKAVYSVMTYAADVCDRHADLHTLAIAERQEMSMEEAEPYIRVTKWFCAGVATYVVFVWSLKINMLFFYKRVVNGTSLKSLPRQTVFEAKLMDGF